MIWSLNERSFEMEFLFPLPVEVVYYLENMQKHHSNESCQLVL